jgi:hypothetical protein
MTSSSPWPVIHSERAALADELASVPESAWNTPSLCEGWTVHQALGHMVATAKMTPPRFIVKLASSGFRFNAMAAKTRIAGLSLRATDVDWSTGTGPEVAGPILPLVLAMTGRRAALAQLSGPGLDTLAARF